jgi:hypothetical protein
VGVSWRRSRIAAAVVVALVVASWDGAFTALAAALAAAALIGTGCGLASLKPRVRVTLLTASAVSTCGLFVVDLGGWMRVIPAVAVAHFVVAAVPGGLGIAPRPAMGILRELALGLGISLTLPLLIGLSALAAGREAFLVDTIATAAPRFAVMRFVCDALLVTVTVLACSGRRAEPTSGPLSFIFACAVAGLAAARVAWVTSMATLPREVSWSEAPALVDALKLDAHLPLYGSPAQLDSYTYSPLTSLIHHALLAPVGLELSLRAHRAVVGGEQLAACAILAWALAPRLQRAGLGALWSAGTLLYVALLSILAPYIHPDHLVLLAFAIAVALLVAEPRWPRALWWTALFAVCPFATCAKLTGAGLGVGLAVVLAVERRWKPLLVVAASLACAAATVPLFDSTLGAFDFYAIGVQRACPLVLSKLLTLPTTAFGAVSLAIGMSLYAIHRLDRADADRDVVRIAILTAACALGGLVGWIKYAGRDNNLTLLGIGSLCAFLVGGARHLTRAGPTLHPALFQGSVVLALLWLSPPSLPCVGSRRAATLAEAAMVQDVVLRDMVDGRRSLVLLSVAAWIEAGRRDVPPDRFQSAVELYFGGFPDALLLFAHIEDGRYDTIVVNGVELRAESTLVGAFRSQLRAAIESRYYLAGPLGVTAIDSHPGALVFRRH